MALLKLRARCLLNMYSRNLSSVCLEITGVLSYSEPSCLVKLKPNALLASLNFDLLLLMNISVSKTERLRSNLSSHTSQNRNSWYIFQFSNHPHDLFCCNILFYFVIFKISDNFPSIGSCLSACIEQYTWISLKLTWHISLILLHDFSRSAIL